MLYCTEGEIIMTIRKRLFISNAVIVLTSLVMLMAVMLGVLKVAEKIYMPNFDDLHHVTVTDRNGETLVLNNDVFHENGGELLAKYKSEITSMFILFISVGAGAIILILLLSNIFTQIMLKEIMKPAEILISAAKRIDMQNLDEPIDYSGNDEFKEVCDVFDYMQLHLKEGIEKNLAYEKARTIMITDISHDLRTPLTSVKGFLKGMLDGVASTPEKQKIYMEIAYKKACSMDVLLDKLFYFSKLETKNMPMYLMNVDLKSYLSEYCEALSPELKGKGSDISFECGRT